MPRPIAATMTPTTTRRRVIGLRGRRSKRSRRARSRSSETPFALRVFDERAHEIVAAEVRPQHVAEHEFGVRRLIEQKVREPMLAAGANQQIEFGQIGGVEIAPDQGFVDVAAGASVPAATSAAIARTARASSACEL